MSTKKGNLKTFAYEKIKEKIVKCVFAPGSLLNEQSLADELKISRTPIREALGHLQEDGLITIMPKKGIFVNNITISDMSQLYQVRILLEPYLIPIAGPYLDNDKLLEFRTFFSSLDVDLDNQLVFEKDIEFHKYLADNCNNKYIIQLMNKTLVDNLRVMISTRQKGRTECSNIEHLRVIESLLIGDYAKASELMRKHIENCRDFAFNFYIQDTLPKSVD